MNQILIDPNSEKVEVNPREPSTSEEFFPTDPSEDWFTKMFRDVKQHDGALSNIEHLLLDLEKKKIDLEYSQALASKTTAMDNAALEFIREYRNLARVLFDEYRRKKLNLPQKSG